MTPIPTLAEVLARMPRDPETIARIDAICRRAEYLREHPLTDEQIKAWAERLAADVSGARD